MVYIIFNYNLVYICQKDCAKLTYSQICNKACENEFDSRRYEDTFGKRKKIDDFVPSKAWYGLTKTYRNVKDENTGVYVSFKGGDNYIVQYMKVKPLYIKTFPFIDYYSKKYYTDDLVDKYDWYVPAHAPLFFPSSSPTEMEIFDTSNCRFNGTKVNIIIRQQIVGFLVTKEKTIEFNKCNDYDFHIIYNSMDSVVATVMFFGKLKY